jgi:ribose 1,5-bisphosphokinase
MLADGGRRLIYVVGPSGAGKDTLLRHWLAMLPDPSPVQLARRTITRPAAPGSAAEQHEAVSDAQMSQLLAEGAFALHWRANGLRYGVRHHHLAALARGNWQVVNGSRGHLPALLCVAPLAQVVLVTADPGVLAARLAARGREAPGQIEQRLRRAAELAGHLPAALVIRNEGCVEAAAKRLHDWWVSQANRAADGPLHGIRSNSGGALAPADAPQHC